MEPGRNRDAKRRDHEEKTRIPNWHETGMNLARANSVQFSGDFSAVFRRRFPTDFLPFSYLVSWVHRGVNRPETTEDFQIFSQCVFACFPSDLRRAVPVRSPAYRHSRSDRRTRFPVRQAALCRRDDRTIPSSNGNRPQEHVRFRL